jgi:hypothetical protein
VKSTGHEALDDKQAHLVGGLSRGGRAVRAVHGENYFLGGEVRRRRVGSREDFLSFQRRLLGHRLVFHDGEYPFYMLVSAYVRMRALGQRKLGRDSGSDCPMGGRARRACLKSCPLASY